MAAPVDCAPILDRPVRTGRSRASTMRVVVRIDGRLTVWHADLLERLARRPGITVSVDGRPGPEERLAGTALLRHAERVLTPGLARDVSAAPAPSRAADRFGRRPAPDADLLIDLTERADPVAVRTWRLVFDGATGLPALQRSLLNGRTPLVEIREDATLVAAARIGTETGGVFAMALGDTLARVTTLILAALSGAAASPLPALPEAAQAPARPSVRPVARFAAKALVRAATRPVYRACFRAPHWRTGWRRLDGPDLFDLRAHPAGGWRDMPDDGRRFYADPFPLEHGNTLTLFVEEFPHAAGKGVISAVEFGPDGPLGRPVPVLEQPSHLSYPFVFVHDGAVWMIPESGAAGSVDLFRSTAFPGGWVKEKTLLSGLVASDATLVRHAGLWWMFATVREGGGAFSDALHLWFAEDLLGPWTTHPRNPVLIDIASARPAGRMVRRGAALLRPVQDCRAGYGAALGIARVTRLDPDGFEQVVETILTAGPLWAGRRLHTLNSGGGYEFIDGSAFAPRWRRGRP